MIISLGTDLVTISRVRRLARRFPDRIGKRLFTEGELAYCLRKSDPAPSLAARFAAKEAVMKVLGTGWSRGVRFIDIEVTRAPSGKPSLALHGRAGEIANRLGISTFHISLTHEQDTAIATIIATND